MARIVSLAVLLVFGLVGVCSAQFDSPRGGANHVAFGIKVSTLGVGLEAATPLGRSLNLRAGANTFRFRRGLDNDGIRYAGSLELRSVEAHLDWFPFGGGFHLSPGLLVYNGNRITATALVPGGSSFTLNDVTYWSHPADPVTGSGLLKFKRTAPMLTFGAGNLLPRSGRHFSFPFEAGVVFQGRPQTQLNLAGSVCSSSGANCRSITSDASVQSDIRAQEASISKGVAPFRFYPVISFGFSVNF